MELIRGLHNLEPRHRGCVATIGNFDGVHLGHQAIVAQLRERAAEVGLPAVVVLFEPQPQEFFQGPAAPARLMRLRDKCEALAPYGVDRIICIRFDPDFAGLTAEAFVDEVLVRGLGVKHLVIGDDFRFGRGRAGNYAYLKEAGGRHGFGVEPIAPFLLDGQRVSSTRVRQALIAGDLAGARRLLGRPYRISGHIAHGDKRGRTIGVPTANVFLHRRVSPLKGVYIVRVGGLGPTPLPGVANIGTRPTVDGSRMLLEVHIFDFTDDAYGRCVQVDFLHKLRDEQRFASFDELKARITHDLTQARQWLRETENQTTE